MLKKNKSPVDPSATDHTNGAQADDPLLTVVEAANYLRASKSYFDKLRVYGGGPEFCRWGKRKILYRKSSLDSWARQRRFSSTSEY